MLILGGILLEKRKFGRKMQTHKKFSLLQQNSTKKVRNHLSSPSSPISWRSLSTTIPPPLSQVISMANLVLKYNTEALTQAVHNPTLEWNPQLVDKILKLPWNNGPKALEFFKILDRHPNYAHSSSSFDHAIDIIGRMQHYKNLWTLVAQLRSPRLGFGSKMFTPRGIWQLENLI